MYQGIYRLFALSAWNGASDSICSASLKASIAQYHTKSRSAQAPESWEECSYSWAIWEFHCGQHLAQQSCSTVPLISLFVEARTLFAGLHQANVWGHSSSAVKGWLLWISISWYQEKQTYTSRGKRDSNFTTSIMRPSRTASDIASRSSFVGALLSDRRTYRMSLPVIALTNKGN